MTTARASIGVGIDVGGTRKGFHMVGIDGGMAIRRVQHAHSVNDALEVLREWGGRTSIPVVAIDSPCKWGINAGSRQAERDLKLCESKVHCFCTPSEHRADEHKAKALASGRNDFYGWVRNGMALFDALADDWPLYLGEYRQPTAIETFPQAVSCYLQGRVVKRDRRNRLQLVKSLANGAEQLGRDPDFIDAALCAIAARAFVANADTLGQTFQKFGNAPEGFIVVPRCSWRP